MLLDQIPPSISYKKFFFGVKSKNLVSFFPLHLYLLCILRYKNKLPSVDIFVCTGDLKMEPPTMVITTCPISHVIQLYT